MHIIYQSTDWNGSFPVHETIEITVVVSVAIQCTLAYINAHARGALLSRRDTNRTENPTRLNAINLNYAERVRAVRSSGCRVFEIRSIAASHSAHNTFR